MTLENGAGVWSQPVSTTAHATNLSCIRDGRIYFSHHKQFIMEPLTNVTNEPAGWVWDIFQRLAWMLGQLLLQRPIHALRGTKGPWSMNGQRINLTANGGWRADSVIATELTLISVNNPGWDEVVTGVKVTILCNSNESLLITAQRPARAWKHGAHILQTFKTLAMFPFSCHHMLPSTGKSGTKFLKQWIQDMKDCTLTVLKNTITAICPTNLFKAGSQDPSRALVCACGAGVIAVGAKVRSSRSGGMCLRNWATNSARQRTLEPSVGTAHLAHVADRFLHGEAGWDAAKHSEDCRKECHGHSTAHSRTPLAKEVEYDGRSRQADSTTDFRAHWACNMPASWQPLDWSGFAFHEVLGQGGVAFVQKATADGWMVAVKPPRPEFKDEGRQRGSISRAAHAGAILSTQRWWLRTVWFQQTHKDWSWSYWARPCFSSPNAGRYPPETLPTYAMRLLRLLRLCISCSGSPSSMATWSHQMFAWAMKPNGPVS